MRTPIVGLHHVTAIASDPQRNLDFYTQVLGLRFVKRTVNFDDPGTYHFYFGDDTGTPGTILTFFPWPGAQRGRVGAGETIATAFSIPAGSLPYWRERLAGKGIAFEEHLHFDNTHLRFTDPDGMTLELVEHTEAHPGAAPRYADVPAEHAIQGFFGTTLLELSLMRTQALLGIMATASSAKKETVPVMRLKVMLVGASSTSWWTRTHSPAVREPAACTTSPSAARDDDAQQDWQQELARYVSVTPVQDRTYFHSIYFREPGGSCSRSQRMPGFPDRRAR